MGSRLEEGCGSDKVTLNPMNNREASSIIEFGREYFFSTREAALHDFLMKAPLSRHLGIRDPWTAGLTRPEPLAFAFMALCDCPFPKVFSS